MTIPSVYVYMSDRFERDSPLYVRHSFVVLFPVAPLARDHRHYESWSVVRLVNCPPRARQPDAWRQRRHLEDK